MNDLLWVGLQKHFLISFLPKIQDCINGCVMVNVLARVL